MNYNQINQFQIKIQNEFDEDEYLHPKTLIYDLHPTRNHSLKLSTLKFFIPTPKKGFFLVIFCYFIMGAILCIF